MLDFSTLKANSGKKTLDQLTSKLASVSGGESKSGDENFWKPTVDKAGNGYAVIRFLPAPANEDVPFVRVFDHGFQGPGGWYIEKSLTTLGQDDPVSQYNSKLWNSGIESDKDIARKQKRRLQFYSNIYVVQDPGNPANEGKVLLYRYGKKIFDKLNEAMNPQFEDEQAINPFDFWAGANFKLKIRQVEGYRNYDKSEFDSASPLLEDDSELEAVWKKEHSLAEIIDPNNFKSYAELKAKLARVLGEGAEPHAAPQPVASAPVSPAAVSAESLPWNDTPQQVAEATPMASASSYQQSNDDEDDESLAFFKNLAND
jgi:hypothetical protein